MADMVSILNTILANGSADYQSRVPEATRTNLAAVGDAITTYSPTQNEFLNKMVNKIALQIVVNKMAKNPLAILKKGGKPLGKDIEEIFTNMQKAEKFDATGSNMLLRSIPDTKTLYHKMNRQDKYKITITQQQLKTAFTDFSKLEEMLNSIVNSMYSGDNYDEFLLMKNLFADAITDGLIVTCDAPAVTSEATGKAFLKQVQLASEEFVFPSTSFNRYAAKAGTGATAITTWTPKENQILLLRADVKVNLDIEVLAAAFNMDKASFMGRILTVDNFGTATNCQAILIDEHVPQIYDDLFETTNFFNGEGLYTNYWLHHWQTYGFSLFGNAVAFVQPAA